ncbi:hypothetical protein GCU56_22710 [Geodermatophilus sabuli]|uniref:Uncharacterized protein n=1 Tax=Geodermatophilus sabuli TaxID=1564158 RepID=A0A7K3W765_9ACTN|nr:hypothetical protein [Geodermatophilus sabuli]NEK60672.1 hypothetical protein [Geodermatophilus sabuli]
MRTSAARLGVLLLAVLAVLLTTGGPAGAAPAPTADRVLVVGVPGLVWSDVDPAGTPNLWALAEDAPISAVSVRAARSTTCLLDGWATLGAGNRARFPAPDEIPPPVPLPTVPLPGETPDAGGGPADDAPADDAPPGEQAVPVPAPTPSLSHCGLQERLASAGLADPRSAVAAVAADRASARFGAEPAALGAAVGCATVVGRAPAVAVAAPGVALAQQEGLPVDAGLLGDLLAGCPLTLVSLDALTDAGEPGLEGSDTGTEERLRATALAAIDTAVGRLTEAVAAAPGETLLLLQGVSEVGDGRPQLHVGIASGPGHTGAGWLTSASTGRAPFTQLIDVAPTVLGALGLDVPASMNGQPLQVDGPRPALPEAVDVLTDANTAATVHHRSTGTFFWALVAVDAAVVGLGLLAAGGRRRDRAPRPAGEALRSVLRPVALGAAALPVATYLAGLVPWERAGGGPAGLVMAGSVLGAALLVLAVAALGPWRHHRLGPPAAILVITLATLVGDVLTGSQLELNGLLGYDAIVAGRFTGYGNLSFGLLAVSALLLTAAAATAAGRRAPAGRARLVVAGTVLGAGVLTVLVIGTPGLGRDFGGVLAALPGFLLLAMLLTRTRVTVTRLAGVLALAVLAVGTLAVLDWLRPAAERSHLGRFVEQLLTGEAWTVVGRKARANLDILFGSPLAWLLPVALVAAVWLVRPGGRARGRWGSRLPAPLRGPGLLRGRDDLLPAGDLAALRAGLVAVALSLVVGAAVNDSGVALPATAAALLVPLLVWLGAGRRAPGAGAAAGRTHRSAPVPGADRVTVVSRGSTVGNV